MNRRQYLAVGTSVALSGCLTLEETDTGGDSTGTGTTISTEPSSTQSGTSVQTETATEEWSFRTAAPVGGVPNADETRVYVHSSDRRLYGLDRRSGEKDWATEVGDILVKRPTIQDGMVLVESKEGLTGLDSEGGSIQWRASVSGRPLARKPPTHNGLVFTAGNQKLLALDTESGQTEWEQTIDGTVFRWGGKMQSGKLFVLIETGDGYPKLVHFDPETGEKTRHLTLSVKPKWAGLSVFALTDSRIVLDMQRNGIEGFERDSGDPVWSVPHAEGARPHYRLSEGRLFVKSLFEEYGGLIALDAKDGNLLWEYDALGVCCFASPVVKGDTLIAGNTDSNRPLAGFDVASGELRWTHTSDFDVEGGIGVDEDSIFVSGADARIYHFESKES